ncbi:MAG: DMT family transporter [Chitinophagales bacterium]
MNNFISKLNNSWFQLVFMVALLAAMNIGIEQLTNKKITGAEVLFIRAICNLLLAFIIAAFNKKSILPKQPKLQIGAFICLGLSLLLIFTAYQYISAGSVSTLQRLDIPLLTLITLFSRKSSTKQVLLSFFAFAVVAALLIFNKSTDEKPMGYLLVLAGVIVIAINTLLQKEIAARENIETIMVVVSASSVFWGGIRCWQAHSTFDNISINVLLAIIGLSLINLIIFYLVNDLYKKHSPEFVRYPYLIAAFVTMIVEMIVKQKISSPLLIGGNIAILITLTLLVRSRQKNE